MMAMGPWIVLACWASFVLYWVISARSVKRTVESHAGFSNFRWLVIAAALLFVWLGGFAGTRKASTPLIAPGGATSAASIGLCVLGLAIAIAARRKLAGNWSSGVVLKQDHELMTTGPYRLVRHPI